MDALTDFGLDAGFRYNEYLDASWVSKLKESGLVIMTDLDKTMTTGDKVPAGKELADRRDVRSFMDAHKAVSASVSARTLGLMLSSTSLRGAQRKGYKEPEPHCGVDPNSGKRIFMPIEQEAFFADCIDMDMLASFGEGIMVRQHDGYAVDQEYDDLLKMGESENQRKERSMRSKLTSMLGAREQFQAMFDDPEVTSDQWRIETLTFLFSVMPDARNYLHDIEFGEKYREGKTDVSPLKARIQMHFSGGEGRAKLLELRANIRRARALGSEYAKRIETVDESKIFHADPEKNNYVLYLVPRSARKENLIRRMLNGAAAAGERPVESLRFFYADDALTGFKAGLWGGSRAPTHFLLPTGSPLAPFILERRSHYGLEPLTNLWKNPWQTEDRLRPVVGKPGVYNFHVSTRRRWINTIVIGDVRYPNMTPPGSLAAFLEEFV